MGADASARHTHTQGSRSMGVSDLHGDTVFDVGEITVAVPQGWKAFVNFDIHADEPGTLSTNSVTVMKGATSDINYYLNPYVKLDYRGKDIYLAPPMKLFFDNVVELEPITLGGRCWQGFKGESLGYPSVMLYIDEGDDQYLVSVSCGKGEGAISLDDDEVRRIIASLTVKSLEAEQR